QPISEEFEPDAMAVNGLDRARLVREGLDPADAMSRAKDWTMAHAGEGTPVLVAYPLSFDWSWLHWYFVRFTGSSPFKHSRAFDMKTAIAVRGRRLISESGHKHLPDALKSALPHTHNALDDARSQADIFAKLMEWDGT
ncbi:MAG: 3'-5' exoribonuclease, partial [Polyangiales bacterium]